MNDQFGRTLKVERLANVKQAQVCAKMMSTSEPWITLGRDFEASLRAIIDPSREVYVAYLGDDIIGFTILCLVGAFVGYIQSICIEPAFRGQGLGTKLIWHAEKRIFGEYPNVFICVSSFNEGARNLYIRNGYQVIGELQDYIIPGESELLLRKSISPLMGFGPRQDD